MSSYISDDIVSKHRKKMWYIILPYLTNLWIYLIYRHNQKQRQTKHGWNIPNYCESDKPKGIKRENESATLYLTSPMTEVAESSSSNSDLGD